MGITLPDPPAPAGAYMATLAVGSLGFVSGQIPMLDGHVQYTGKVSDSNMKEAQESARLCAINILAQINKRWGLDRVQRIVRLSGFVNAEPGFVKHPQVIDFASNLMYDIFGDRGKHTRVAVGVSSLPLDSMTEIDGTIQIQS